MVTKEQNTFFNVIKQARAFLSLGIKSTVNASMIDVKHLLRLKYKRLTLSDPS